MGDPIPVLLEETLKKAMNRATITALLIDMRPEERLEIFSRFCQHCGSDDPRCQCWNDE